MFVPETSLPPNSARVKSPIPIFFLFSIFSFDLMPFTSCRFLRWGRSLGLAPKKSLALQAGWTSPPDVAPVSGRSGADVAASSADLAAPAVAPTPVVVVEQAAVAVAVTPPSSSERMEPPPVLVASSVVGAAPQAEGPASPVEVAATAPSQEQPDAATVVSEGRHNPSLRRPRPR